MPLLTDPNAIFKPKQPAQTFGQPVSQPAQPNYGSNTNWASGVKAWDPKNTFSAPNPTPGMTATGPKTWNMTMGAGPTPGMTADPMPDTQVSTAAPYAGGFTYMDHGPQNQNVATPMANPYMPAPQQPVYQPPAPSQGYNPAAFNTQYGTLENLQPYMNPFLDQIIAKGNKAIESSAAARGGLLSSRTGQEIGDWTTGAQSQAYNDARSAFNTDRNYMTGVYQDGRNFDYKNFRDTDNFGFDVFKYGDAAQRGLLNDYYTQNNGLVNTGVNASNNAGNIQAAFMDAIAKLHGEQGNVNAQGAVNGANNNSGALNLLTGLLPMLFGGG